MLLSVVCKLLIMAKVLLVCISIHHGNTLKVAEGMTEAVDAEILKPFDVDQDLIRRYDIIGFGSGIYYGRHHRSIFSLLDKIELKGKPVFIFYTSGAPKIPILNGCDEALKRKLRKKNAKIVGVFGCRGFSNPGPLKLVGGICKGRPSEEDLEKARKFVMEVVSSTIR